MVTKRETVAVRKGIAKALYYPEGKNGYYKENTIINNFGDLVNTIDNFTSEEEALWIASWIEYLGDDRLAQQITRKPADIKKLVLNRHKQLVQYK